MKFRENDPLLTTLDILWHDLARVFALGRFDDHNKINELFIDLHEEEDPLETLRIVYERNARSPRIDFETILGIAIMTVRGEPEKPDLYRKRLNEASQKLTDLREALHD